jgi:iron complex outermembrane recepter protein
MKILRKTNRTSASLVALALATLTASSGVMAQTAEPVVPVASLDEIVVTAKGRNEKLEDVALSIATISADSLRELQVRDLRDLAGYVPSLVLEASRGRASASTFAIRGLAPNTINKQLQSVSVFLDGVFLGGSASVMDFPDIEGIEVLRGPQATQFGRQTYAGAIGYRTRERTPDDIEVRADGFISKNSGAEDINREISAGIAFPVLPEKMWLTFHTRQKRLGSLASKTNAVRTIEIGQEKTQAYSGSLLFKPNDDFSVKFLFMHQKERDSTPAFTTMQVQEWQADGTELSTIGGILWPTDELGDVSPEMAGCESAAGRPFNCGLDRDQTFMSIVAKYRFADGYEVSLRGGHQTEKSWTNQDLYFRQSPDPFFGTQAYSRRSTNTATTPTKLANPFFSATSDDYSADSLELRVKSPGTDRLRWQAGGFYYTESLTNFAVINRTASNPDGRSRGDEDVRNIAVFGDVAFDVTPWLTLEAEARYDVERNTFGACTICSTAATGSFNANEIQRTNKEFLPRFTVQVKPTESSMVYALYSEGTKPGRWNQTIRTNFAYVEPELNKNYEVGFKGRFLDDRLFFSSAAFIMKVKDQQFAAVSTATGTAITVFQNIGSSKIKGLEAETKFQITPDFGVRGGIAYAKHEYTTNAAPDDVNLIRLFNGSTFDGKTSIGLPKWTGSVGADYGMDLTDDLRMRLSASANYIGTRFADSANLAKLAAVWRANLSAGLDYKAYSVSFFVKDLFDNNKASSAAVSATNSCLYLARPGGGTYSLNPEQRCLAVGIDRGREIGVNLSIKFE